MTQSKGEMSRQALYQQIETNILKEMHKILGQSLDEGPHDNPLSTLSTLAYVLESLQRQAQHGSHEHKRTRSNSRWYA